MRKKEERKRDAGREERRPFCVRVERLDQRLREEAWGSPEGVRGAEKGNDARGKGWVCGRIGKL